MSEWFPEIAPCKILQDVSVSSWVLYCTFCFCTLQALVWIHPHRAELRHWALGAFWTPMGKQEQSKDAETCWNKRTWHCQKRCQTKSSTIPNYHHILSVVWVACAKLSVTETKSKATLGIAWPVQCCTSTTAKHGRNRIAVSLRPQHALPTWSTLNNQTKTPRVIQQHWGVHIGAYIGPIQIEQGALKQTCAGNTEIAILYNESLGFIAVSHGKWQHGHHASWALHASVS